MNTALLNKPLSESELDAFGVRLARFDSERAMNLEMCDGFFAALHCAPQVIPPSVFLPELWGGDEQDGDDAFASMEEYEAFTSLVLRHWNDVGRRLSDGGAFLPIVYDNQAGYYPGNDWARGFFAGMEHHGPDWSDLVGDDEQFAGVLALFALAHEHDADPEARPYQEPISTERREQLLIGLSAGVMRTYRYFEPHRKRAARGAKEQGTVRRAGPKPGRNTLCPCGSGKKYKKCCGSATLH